MSERQGVLIKLGGLGGLSGRVKEGREPGARGRQRGHVPCTEWKTGLSTVTFLISCDDPTRSQDGICFT